MDIDFSNKKEIERQRREFAINEINKLGIDVTIISVSEIQFNYEGSVIKFYPYSGWATGKTIKDCRGIRNLLKQL